MSFGIKVYAENPSLNKSRYGIEPHWWVQNDLKKEYSFIETCEDNVYLDYILKVNKERFLKIMLSQERKFFPKFHSYTVSSFKEKVLQQREDLLDLYLNLQEKDVVIIKIFEYDSM